MGNCLVTKLNGVVNNNSLDYFNKLKITYRSETPGTKVFTVFDINEGDQVTFSILSGNAKFIPNESTAELDTITLTGLNLPHLPAYKDKAFCEIKHLNDKTVTILAENLSNGLLKGIANITGEVNLSKFFKYSPNANRIFIISGAARGELNLEYLSDIPVSIKTFKVEGGTIGKLKGGSVSDLARLVNVESLIITDNFLITGDIATLGVLTNCTDLGLFKQKVYGTVESFAAAQVTAGRTSGSIRVSFSGNNVTYLVNDVPTPVPFYLYIDYSSSYEGGYQISTTAP